MLLISDRQGKNKVMVLRGLGRQVSQGIEGFVSQGSQQYQVFRAQPSLEGVDPSSSSSRFNPETVLSRLPFAQPRMKPLVARLLGASPPSEKPPQPQLSESQEKLLNELNSVELARSELEVFNLETGEALSPAGLRALQGYREELMDRVEALELRGSEELGTLEEQILALSSELSPEGDSSDEGTELEAELFRLESQSEALEAKLSDLGSLREELELSESQDGAILLEELRGPAADILEMEASYLQSDWTSSVESLKQRAPQFSKLIAIESQLSEIASPSLENLGRLILLEAQADLWAVAESRVEQFGEMMKYSGITDGIVNLGGLTKEDLTYAQEYNTQQSRYIEVLAKLRENRPEEALALFQGLESSAETKILFEAFEDVETINACTINALTVVGAGAVARLAMPLVRGLALAGNVSSKAIPALQFGGQVSAFTVSHRQLDAWVMEESFFDPKLSALENAEELGKELLFNAGMFGFLGMSQKLFMAAEAKVLHGLARSQGARTSLRQYGPMTIEAEAASSIILRQMQRSPLMKLAHTTGSFGTELVGFGAWDYLAANLQGLANGDYDAKRIFQETLGSREKWEHNLVFLAALKSGGALAAPVFRPMNRAAESFAKAKYEQKLSAIEQNSRDCAEALEAYLGNPKGSLGLLAEYEAALGKKAELMRSLPEGQAHPLGLALVEGEIQNIRELSRAIRAGVFDASANDGEYGQLPPRIDTVADAGSAANDGKYGASQAKSIRMAVGAEVFVVGEREQRTSEVSGKDASELGLQVFNMDGSGEVSSRKMGSLSLTSGQASGAKELLNFVRGAGQAEVDGVLGDYLQRQGSLHGELMALELKRTELEELGQRETEEYRRIDAEVKDGYTRIEAELRASLGEAAKHLEFCWGRGMIEEVKVGAKTKASDLRELFERGETLMMRRMVIEGGAQEQDRVPLDEFREMMELKGMEQIRVLSLRDGKYGAAYAAVMAASDTLAGGKTFSNLIELDLSFNNLGAAGAMALVSTETFSNLQVLRLNNNNLGVAGAEALAASETFSNLLVLALSGNRLGSEGVTVLAGGKTFSNLRKLDLAENNVGDSGAEALVGSKYMSNIWELILDYNYLTDRAVQELAGSPYMSNLRVLSLGSNRFGDLAATALAGSERMSNLQVLILRGNDIGDTGVEALAGSRHLSNILELNLENTLFGIAAMGALTSRFGEKVKI